MEPAPWQRAPEPGQSQPGAWGTFGWDKARASKWGGSLNPAGLGRY